jgi:hypothetical protein
MAGGGEDRHVGTDLGDDHLGGALLDAGDRAEQLNRPRERADLLLDRGRGGALPPSYGSTIGYAISSCSGSGPSPVSSSACTRGPNTAREASARSRSL